MNHHTDTPARFLKVPGHTRLYRRENGIYYLRAKVPHRIRPILDLTELRVSLKTTDYKKALALVKIESLKADRRFENAERQVDAHKPAPRRLTREELVWIVSDWFVKTEGESEEWAEGPLKGFEPEDAVAMAQVLKEDAQVLTRSPHNTHEEATEIAVSDLDAFLTGEGKRWGIEKGSEDYARILPMFRDCKAEAMSRTIERIEDFLEEKRIGQGGPARLRRRRDQAYANLTAHTFLPEAPRPTMFLGKFLDDFMDYQRKTHTETTPASYALPVRALREVLGENTPLHSIKRPQIEKVCALLGSLPKNATKKYGGLSLEAATVAAEREGYGTKRSERTLKNEYDLIVAIFNFAVDDGLIAENPAKGRKLRASFKVRKQRKRVPFETEELQKIFSAPLYTGCQNDDRGYFREGPERPRRARFWIPLLALFHGCRMNELCQLYVEDIKTTDGIPYLSIRTELDDEEIEDTGKRQKTDASTREIPIHPELHRIGFMQYVAERKADTSSPMLFPTLKKYAKTGRYSKQFSRWFASFLIRAVGYKPKAVFHSFRHNFRAACMQAKLPVDIVEMLGGWEPHEASSETIYRHADIRLRHKAIAKIRYRGLDLTHLYALNCTGVQKAGV